MLKNHCETQQSFVLNQLQVKELACMKLRAQHNKACQTTGIFLKF